MGRYKYLFKNIGLLTLSSFGTKGSSTKGGS